MTYANLLIHPFFEHSAKGSEWKNHKYIKKINGDYYYPDSYEGGRHIPGGDNSDFDVDDTYELDESDIEILARQVIRGEYGNGQVRKELLGYNYQRIQDRVNEILLGSNSTRINDISSETIKEAEEVIEQVLQSPSTTGIDLDVIYSVYNKTK